MREVGIFYGDVLLDDKANEPKHGQIVVAVVNGDLVCKTLYQRAGLTKLRPANVTFPEIIPSQVKRLKSGA